LFGVPVRFHFTFVLLLVFLVVIGVGGRQSGLRQALYLLALFASVLLHELGHAVVSRRYGIRTLEIVMFPIGGVARLERQPKPKEELWIAIAGPAVNLVIAAVIVGVLVSEHGASLVGQLADPFGGTLWARVAGGNLVLTLFNLLPAFPMDGGRILRSILALWRPEDEATRVAAGAGRLLAVVMGLLGLLSGNFILVFTAFFIYLGASQEATMAAGRSLTQGMPVRAAMVTDFRTLEHGNTIREAAALLIATSQQDFPVMHGAEVTGLLGRSALIKAMATAGPDTYVAGVMNRDFVRLPPDTDLAAALPMMRQAGSCALVMEGGRLLGLLTAENLAEFLVLRKLETKHD
jgi:Zn-dependent protease/CBS domain-containing protein